MTMRPPELLSVDEMEAKAGGMRWLVKHVLPAAGVSVLYGASGTYKSFVALDAALHVVHGLNWLGQRTVRGEVVYIASEGGLGLFNRIRAWHLARRREWRGCPLRVVTGAIELRSEAGALVRAIDGAGLRPALVVVDTLSQSYSGDENDAAQMSSFFRVLVGALVSRYSCTVLVVHHTGHAATERPRGSSAIIANTDAVFGCFRSESGLLATVECQKQKDGAILPPVTFKLDVVPLGVDEDGDPISSLSARHIADPAALAAAVAGSEGPRGVILEIARLGLPLSDARKRFFAAYDAENYEAKKKAWQRAMHWAESAGLTAVREGILTLTVGKD